MTYQRTCEYCGTDFEAKRSHARYCDEPCSTQGWVEEQVYGPRNALGEASEHPLAEVRAEQEAKADKARWTLIVREHMARTLNETGYFHSDDLEPLGIPDQHRQIAGSQTGGFVSRGLMEEVGRRASSKPSRRKAKSAIYKITAKGRNEIPKLLVGFGSAGGHVAAESGEKASSPVAGTGVGCVECPSREARGVGENPPADAGTPEPLSLLGDEGERRRPNHFDVDQELAA